MYLIYIPFLFFFSSSMSKLNETKFKVDLFCVHHPLSVTGYFAT